MKLFKFFLVAAVASALLASLAMPSRVSSQTIFDGLTNGFTTQVQFDADRAAFEEREEKADGLGPVYNAQACVECHQNRMTGGNSQIFELRAGHSGPDGTFVPAPGGSLIQSRAINTAIQERVPDGARIAFMSSGGQITVMGFDGGSHGPVGNSPGGRHPSFSPDGRRDSLRATWAANQHLGHEQRRDEPATGDSRRAGLHPRVVARRDEDRFQPHAHGRAQIFTMNPDGTDQTNISNMAAPTTAARVVARQDADSLRGHAERPRHLREDLDDELGGTGQMQITNGPGTDERPSYAPDGTTIAFSTDRDGNCEIYKIPRPAARDAADKQPGLRPRPRVGARQLGHRLRQQPQRRPENLGRRPTAPT